MNKLDKALLIERLELSQKQRNKNKECFRERAINAALKKELRRLKAGEQPF